MGPKSLLREPGGSQRESLSGCRLSSELPSFLLHFFMSYHIILPECGTMQPPLSTDRGWRDANGQFCGCPCVILR